MLGIQWIYVNILEEREGRKQGEGREGKAVEGKREKDI